MYSRAEPAVAASVGSEKRRVRLDLPDEVLKKLCYENALRIIPGIDASLFRDPDGYRLEITTYDL